MDSNTRIGEEQTAACVEIRREKVTEISGIALIYTVLKQLDHELWDIQFPSVMETFAVCSTKLRDIRNNVGQARNRKAKFTRTLRDGWGDEVGHVGLDAYPKKYILSVQRKYGAESICILEEDIVKFLKAAREVHGHYSDASPASTGTLCGTLCMLPGSRKARPKDEQDIEVCGGFCVQERVRVSNKHGAESVTSLITDISENLDDLF